MPCLPHGSIKGGFVMANDANIKEINRLYCLLGMYTHNTLHIEGITDAEAIAKIKKQNETITAEVNKIKGVI